MVCGRCGCEKELHSFAKDSSRGKERYKKWCIECFDAYRREWYQKKKLKGNTPIGFNPTRIKNRKLLGQYLTGKSCVDCGYSDVRALDFDHVDRATKMGNVSSLIGRYNWDVVFNEIKKCVIRCSNCHRIKTAIEGGYQYFYFPEPAGSCVS